MSKETWKNFEGNALTHSAAHYLMAIHELTQEQGYARVTDVARYLGITRGSCSLSLKVLRRRNLVDDDRNRFLKLTPEGLRLAQVVEANDELLEQLFTDLLGIEPAQAEIDACKIEHLISIETSLRLRRLVRFLDSNKPEVKAFLRELRDFEPNSCLQDGEVCTFCDDTCRLRESASEAD